MTRFAVVVDDPQAAQAHGFVIDAADMDRARREAAVLAVQIDKRLQDCGNPDTVQVWANAGELRADG